MKRWIGPLLMAGTFTACRQSAFQESLKRADEVTIAFYSSSKSDSVYKIVHSNSPDAIAQLAGYITDKAAAGPDCGRDGQAVFKKGDTEIATVRFSLTDCKVFEYTEQAVQKKQY